MQRTNLIFCHTTACMNKLQGVLQVVTKVNCPYQNVSARPHGRAENDSLTSVDSISSHCNPIGDLLGNKMATLHQYQVV